MQRLEDIYMMKMFNMLYSLLGTTSVCFELVHNMYCAYFQAIAAKKKMKTRAKLTVNRFFYIFLTDNNNIEESLYLNVPSLVQFHCFVLRRLYLVLKIRITTVVPASRSFVRGVNNHISGQIICCITRSL